MNFNLPPGGVYYHYTTRVAAQEISITGELIPGRYGRIYLTDVLYQLGWQATDRLALPTATAEVALVVPPDALDGLSLTYEGMVPIWTSPSGGISRRGGGHQWVVLQPIRLAIYPWSWIQLQWP